MGGDLPVRAAAGVILMVAALIAAWAGGFPFLAFWLVASALVLWEWQKLIGADRLLARVALGALTLVAASPLALHGSAKSALAALALGAVLTGCLCISRRRCGCHRRDARPGQDHDLRRHDCHRHRNDTHEPEPGRGRFRLPVSAPERSCFPVGCNSCGENRRGVAHLRDDRSWRSIRGHLCPGHPED
ncbi:MAG: hypothetical protein ACLPSW_10525, partial [Roseiarcus sp.]